MLLMHMLLVVNNCLLYRILLSRCYFTLVALSPIAADGCVTCIILVLLLLLQSVACVVPLCHKVVAEH